MGIQNYRDLLVWQKSMDLTDQIYRLSRSLPKEELYCLSDQMRRAAVSVPSNIAEGCRRGSTKEYLRFLHIACGSTAELETQLEIAVRQELFTRQQISSAYHLCLEIEKMLRTIIYRLRVSQE